MREKCFVDTSVLVKVILEKRVDVLETLLDYSLYTSVNVLEECAFKIIMASVADEMNEEKPHFYTLKQKFEKEGSSLAVERLHVLNEIKQGLCVLSLDEEIFETAKMLVKQYKLLPNDALIASTCKHNGIQLIATYDSDFSRVPFLKVLTPEKSC